MMNKKYKNNQQFEFCPSCKNYPTQIPSVFAPKGWVWLKRGCYRNLVIFLLRKASEYSSISVASQRFKRLRPYLNIHEQSEMSPASKALQSERRPSTETLAGELVRTARRRRAHVREPRRQPYPYNSSSYSSERWRTAKVARLTYPGVAPPGSRLAAPSQADAALFRRSTRDIPLATQCTLYIPPTHTKTHSVS